MDAHGRTVGEVAELAHVTVRTLHHYDAIGLLVPSGRNRAGYRLYDDADLDRLFAALSYRELGFGLEEIAAMLDDGRPVPDHLRRQQKLLREQRDQIDGMLRAIDTALEAEDMGDALTPEEKLELFGDWIADEEAYATEVEERWGETEAFAESQRRVSGYTKDDWLRIKAETTEVERALAAALAAGTPADSADGMDVAEAHRQQIDRWFYQASHELHVGLGRMYVDDPRFSGYYERITPGAAVWLRDAIVANARRAGHPAD
ncbi:MAG: MerR family transcriptional regulator [Nocardioides sp.]